MGAKETEIRRAVQQYLQYAGWFVYHCLQGLGCYPGISDLVAVREGRVVHIEIKTPKGVQSEKQIRFQRKLEAAGGEYIVARDIDDVVHLGGEKQLRIGVNRP